MKIVAINASHRGDKGITRLLIDELFLGATAAGAECEILTLAKFKILRCLSCYRCQNQQPHLVCAYNDKDDVRQLFDQMRSADILIYATPVYLMNMTGLLKTFLDRMYSTMDIRQGRLSNGLIHHHIDASLSSKPFVTLVVCSNVENESSRNVTAYFRTYARFMEAEQVGVLVRNASALFDPDKPALAKQFPKVLEVRQAFQQAGRDLAERGRIRASTQRRTNQEIVPVPFFGLLKHLPPIKRQVIAYLNQSQLLEDPRN